MRTSPALLYRCLSSSRCLRGPRTESSRPLSSTEAQLSSQYVPAGRSVLSSDVEALCDFMSCTSRLLVMTGAGASTESGIPDYRSEGVGLYATSTNRPVQYRDFVNRPEIRQRYWARNYVGWPRFSSLIPNEGHLALAKLEESGHVWEVVTQNVDGLHGKAGSERVTELHGSAHRVLCLSCGHATSRHHMQGEMAELNPGWGAQAQALAPDGDVQLDQHRVASFKVPDCENCGGVLKPDIVFFGDNVPTQRRDNVKSAVESSDALLVVGSSLHVYSGYRLILAAAEHNIPVALVNIGETRADHLASLRIPVQSGPLLSAVMEQFV